MKYSLKNLSDCPGNADALSSMYRQATPPLLRKAYNAHWVDLNEHFPGFQFLVGSGVHLYGAAFTVPLHWDGAADKLPGLALYNLFADIDGDAIVTETHRDGNHITRMQGKFAEMASFPSHTLADKSYSAACSCWRKGATGGGYPSPVPLAEPAAKACAGTPGQALSRRLADGFRPRTTGA